jgi:hypothetical protein
MKKAIGMSVKPSIDISEYTGTIWVYDPQARVRHGHPNRVKATGRTQDRKPTLAGLIKGARRGH